ncbi:MAG TPA: ParB N-terminal domain-containing protein [Streptosporangiaceae bacterium]|nr:ParB N-terminal domain-containing protein [Streptosporangiaceae bacterium]
MAQRGTVELAAGGSVNADRFDLKNLEKLPARNVAISSLAPGLYLRQGGTSAVHVQLLLGAAGSSELPPVLVQEHGCRVIDGLHRLEAAKLRGDETIRARFLDCTDEEALVLAIKSNTTHGLPLCKADRVSGAKRVLDAHPDWSNRAIAGITGLSAKTIASLRDRSGDDPRVGGKRLGRDGKRRPVTPGEGRRRAAEYISGHPDAPLRKVAQEANVSLGTVHDVSARIRRGVDPERNGRKVHAARQPIRSAVPAHGGAEILELAAGTSPGLPLAVTGPPLSRKKQTGTPPTWAAISGKVANDPAIRYTEGGKEFVRWMALHAAHPDLWREFIDAIPVHWLSVLAPIADSLSEEWSLFAERLRSR